MVLEESIVLCCENGVDQVGRYLIISNRGTLFLAKFADQYSVR